MKELTAQEKQAQKERIWKRLEEMEEREHMRIQGSCESRSAYQRAMEDSGHRESDFC